MQKPASTSEIFHNETRIVFVSHMSDWFWEKGLLYSKNLFTFYIKKHTQNYLLKQLSVNKIRNIFNACSKTSTSQQSTGSFGSLWDYSSGWQILFVVLIVDYKRIFCQSSLFQAFVRCWQKGVSTPGLKTEFVR